MRFSAEGTGSCPSDEALLCAVWVSHPAVIIKRLNLLMGHNYPYNNSVFEGRFFNEF